MRELEKIKAPTGCPHIPQLATTTPEATIESNQQRGTSTHPANWRATTGAYSLARRGGVFE